MTPTIEFDTTLKELYDLDCYGHSDIHLVYTIPTVQVQMTKGIPICKKYAYQDPLSSKDSGTQARIYSQVVPQLFGLIAGQVKLIMFDLDDPDSDGIDPQPRLDSETIFEQVREHQRPTLIYVRGGKDVILPPSAVLGVANPMDCLEHLPAMVPPESHYRALSKRELALSGLPTPPTVVVDAVLSAEAIESPEARGAEAARIIGYIRQQALPCVVKLPQALSGQGTFLLRNEAERAEALAVLEPEVDGMLGQINSLNIHLNPTSIVIQDMLPGSAMAISMFLTKSGEPVLTSCCDQFIDPNGHWDGGHVNYPRQPRLMEEYMPIARRIGAYMAQLGYHGPVGADIMTAPDGTHLVIDLNTRVTGSHPLGFLKGFFHVTRGFNDAAVFFPLFLRLSLSEFRTEFETEMEEGRIVIAGWSHERGGRSSVTTIMIAGEAQENLAAVAERVKMFRVPIKGH